MATEERGAGNQAAEGQGGEQPRQRSPWQQVLFDDIFLLLMLGLVIPTLFYIMWGLIDLASVPMFEP